MGSLIIVAVFMSRLGKLLEWNEQISGTGLIGAKLSNVFVQIGKYIT